MTTLRQYVSKSMSASDFGFIWSTQWNCAMYRRCWVGVLSRVYQSCRLRDDIAVPTAQMNAAMTPNGMETMLSHAIDTSVDTIEFAACTLQEALAISPPHPNTAERTAPNALKAIGRPAMIAIIARGTKDTRLGCDFMGVRKN